MKVMLKRQWLLRRFGQRTTLTCETQHHLVPQRHADILPRLAEGIEATDVTLEEFASIEYLNDRNYLMFVDHPDAPAWDLHNAKNFKQVQEQFRHVTFDVRDTSRERVGDYLRDALVRAGMCEADPPRLRLLVANSYNELPDSDTPALPIVCGRMRLSLGPLILPWRQHIRDMTLSSPHYMPTVSYTLPPVFDDLQKAMAAARVLQFVALCQLRYVNNVVEFSMLEQESKLWPIPS